MTAPHRALPEAPNRRGWCPSLARPMPTGDGLLARVHPPLGILTVAQVRAVAKAARRFGNGHVDVTARGNLQIRGVTDATRTPLTAFLTAAGLGDSRCDGGPQRLTLTPPLAGPGALALARAIEEIGLGIQELPPKTLVAIDEATLNSAASPASIDADIRLIFVPEHHAPFSGQAERQRSTIPNPAGDVAQRHDPTPPTSATDLQLCEPGAGPLSWKERDRVRCVTFSESPRPSPQTSVDGSESPWRCLGELSAARLMLAIAGPDGPDWMACPTVEDALCAVETALRTLAASCARRMRDLPPADRVGLVRHLGLARLAPQIEASAAFACGLNDLGDGRTALVLGSQFGRCGADGLDCLADQAEALASEIHFSPSRGFVLVTRNPAEAQSSADALASFGFMTAADDPRAAVAACPGAPACASGSTPTSADAARLADAFRPFSERGLRGHVSGCAKGCAHPAAADLTLVGHDGLYDIVLGGPPGALPAMRLTFEAALERLRRADPSTPLTDAFRTAP